MSTSYSLNWFTRPGDTFRGLSRDLAYVLPGFFISLVSFVLLVPLFAFGVGTLVIWIGAAVLPLTLVAAGAFAQLDRSRLREWSGEDLPAISRPVPDGVTAKLHILADPARWQDLLFATVVGFPLRTATFVISTTWIAGAVGGLTYFAWSVFLPDPHQGVASLVATQVFPGAHVEGYALDAAFNGVCGVNFALTLPAMIRLCARLDEALVRAVIATGPPAGPTTPPSASIGLMANRARVVWDASARRSSDVLAWTLTSCAAAVLMAVGWPVSAAVYGVPVAVAMAMCAVHAAMLPLSVRWPISALVVSSATAVWIAVATQGAGAGVPWPWPVVALITQVLILLTVAMRAAWPVAVFGWVLGVIGSVAAVLLADGDVRADGSVAASTTVFVSVGVGVVVLGGLVAHAARGGWRRDRLERSGSVA